MKLLISLMVLFSLNAFAADQLGYTCTAANRAEEAKLLSLKPRLGRSLLSTIGVLVVDGRKCGQVTIGINKDACKVGPFNLMIGLDGRSTLVVGANKYVRLFCEEEGVAHGNPSSGGSN